MQAEADVSGHSKECPPGQGRTPAKQSGSTDPLPTGLAIAAFTVQQGWVLGCGLEMKTWTESREEKQTNL